MIFIATDSLKIQNVCKKYGAQSILNSNKCLTGTDRVAEVAKKIDSKSTFPLPIITFLLCVFLSFKCTCRIFPLNLYIARPKSIIL